MPNKIKVVKLANLNQNLPTVTEDYHSLAPTERELRAYWQQAVIDERIRKEAQRVGDQGVLNFLLRGE